MPLQKQTFTDVYDKLVDVIDVDDSRGRSVPVNMNFVEESFLSKDTGCSYFSDTSETDEVHSIFTYDKKDGTRYRLRVQGHKIQQENAGIYEDIDQSVGTVTFTVASPTVATATTHGLVEGDTVYFTTTGTLPTGVSLDVPYYVIATGLTANDFQFSDSVGGTAIDVTLAGSGTHTVNKGWRPGARFGYIVYDNELWLGNAVDSLYKWDGTTFTEYASAPKGNILEIFEDRLFITGVLVEPLTIYYSNVGAPQTYTSTDVLNPLGTDHATNLVNYYGTLLIFKEDSIWKLTFVYDQVVSLFVPKLEVQSGNYGACSRKAVTWVENDLWFFTGREVRSIGFQDQQIGVLGINRSVISENIKDTLKSLSIDSYSNVAVFYHDRRFYLSVALSATTNDTIFVCHTLHANNWTKYNDRIKSNAQDFEEVDGVVYSATSSGTYGVLKWDETLLDDNNSAIPCEVFFDRLEDKDFNRFTLYRYLDLMFKDLNASITITLREDASDGRDERSRNFIIGSDTVSDDLMLGQTLVGNAQFGDSYGYSVQYSPFQKRRLSFLSKHQAITIGLSNNSLGETFTLTQFALSGQRRPRKLFKASQIVSM